MGRVNATRSNMNTEMGHVKTVIAAASLIGCPSVGGTSHWPDGHGGVRCSLRCTLGSTPRPLARCVCGSTRPSLASIFSLSLSSPSLYHLSRHALVHKLL